RGVAGDDVGVLVLLDADAVPGPVDEPVAVAGLGDDAARHGVDLLARRADGGGGDRRPLGLVQHRVGVADLGRRLADVHAAGDVAAVADAQLVVHRAPEVAQHDVPGADDPAARLVVGAGGVLAGGDDGEVDRAVALLDDPPPELPGHLGLGPADERDLAGLQRGRDAVDGRGRPAQR